MGSHYLVYRTWRSDHISANFYAKIQKKKNLKGSQTFQQNCICFWVISGLVKLLWVKWIPEPEVRETELAQKPLLHLPHHPFAMTSLFPPYCFVTPTMFKHKAKVTSNSTWFHNFPIFPEWNVSPFTHSFTSTMVLVDGRKLDNLEETHMGIGRTFKMPVSWAQYRNRNPGAHCLYLKSKIYDIETFLKKTKKKNIADSGNIYFSNS